MSEKITLKSEKDLTILREGGQILIEVLQAIKEMLVPGASGTEIDEKVREMVKSKKAFCSFYGFSGYPAHFCLSLNDEVVHGLPFGKIIKEGDVVGVDMGIKYKGLFTDAAFTFLVDSEKLENDSKDVRLKKSLIQTTLDSLKNTLNVCSPGFRVGDIGYLVEKTAKEKGFSVVKNLVGHGVGFAVHEDPIIPNFGQKGQGFRLSPGMVIAIEPMLNVGNDKVYLDSKTNWAFKTSDGSLSAHFEWTVAITKDGPEILTPLDWLKNK